VELLNYLSCWRPQKLWAPARVTSAAQMHRHVAASESVWVKLPDSGVGGWRLAMGGSFAMDSLTGSMLGHFMAKPLSAPKTPPPRPLRAKVLVAHKVSSSRMI